MTAELGCRRVPQYWPHTKTRAMAPPKVTRFVLLLACALAVTSHLPLAAGQGDIKDGIDEIRQSVGDGDINSGAEKLAEVVGGIEVGTHTLSQSC